MEDFKVNVNKLKRIEKKCAKKKKMEYEDGEGKAEGLGSSFSAESRKKKEKRIEEEIKEKEAKKSIRNDIMKAAKIIVAAGKYGKKALKLAMKTKKGKK